MILRGEVAWRLSSRREGREARPDMREMTAALFRLLEREPIG